MTIIGDGSKLAIAAVMTLGVSACGEQPAQQTETAEINDPLMAENDIYAEDMAAGGQNAQDMATADSLNAQEDPLATMAPDMLQEEQASAADAITDEVRTDAQALVSDRGMATVLADPDVETVHKFAILDTDENDVLTATEFAMMNPANLAPAAGTSSARDVGGEPMATQQTSEEFLDGSDLPENEPALNASLTQFSELDENSNDVLSYAEFEDL